MRSMALCVDTSMSGTDDWQFFMVPDHVTQEELDDYGYDAACQHAESYGIYVNEGGEAEDEEGDTWEIYFTWEPYKPEKHDMLVAGGGLPVFQDWD